MSLNPFIPSFDKLPDTLPVFPLPGAIVMPGSELPLNMVNDALGTHRMIGMIQPDSNANDETGLCRRVKGDRFIRHAR